MNKKTDKKEKVDLTSKNGIYYTQFEPLFPNRFVIYIEDEITKKQIIPTFLIKYIDRPCYHLLSNKTKEWYPVKIRVYESIIPCNIYFNILRATVFNITVNELGPVGDVVSQWMLPNCRVSSLYVNPLDWSGKSEVSEIVVELDWNEIIVSDGGSEFKISK